MTERQNSSLILDLAIKSAKIPILLSQQISQQKNAYWRLKHYGRHGIRTHARFYTPTAFPTQPLKPLE